MTTSEERVGLLKAEAQRLEQYLNGLPDEAWLHPSACDQWTVADVIAHLISAVGSHAGYITGAAINIEGGGGGRQIAGLLLHYAAFMGAYAVLRLVLQTFAGPVLSVAFGMVGAAILLPLLARLTFRVVGVRITSAEAVSGESAA